MTTTYRLPQAAATDAFRTQRRLAYLTAGIGAVTLAALAWSVREIEALDLTRPRDPYLYLPLVIMAALTVVMAVYFYRRASWAKLQAELLAVRLHEDSIAVATAHTYRATAAPSLDDDGATWTHYRFSDLTEVRHYGGTGIQLVPKTRPPVMLPAKLEGYGELLARLGEARGVREMPGGRYGGFVMMLWQLSPLIAYYALTVTPPGLTLAVALLGIVLVGTQARQRYGEIANGGVRGYATGIALALVAGYFAYRAYGSVALTE